jgi:hypothetical protein
MTSRRCVSATGHVAAWEEATNKKRLFVCGFRLWRVGYAARRKFSPHGALKPKLAQFDVSLAHDGIGSFTRPLEAFFRQCSVFGNSTH